MAHQICVCRRSLIGSSSRSAHYKHQPTSKASRIVQVMIMQERAMALKRQHSESVIALLDSIEYQQLSLCCEPLLFFLGHVH